MGGRGDHNCNQRYTKSVCDLSCSHGAWRSSSAGTRNYCTGGTGLVALLGCDTGRGLGAGEGVQGLRHALTVAGARSTLLTLWQVGDLSAARFLRELLARSV